MDDIKEIARQAKKRLSSGFWDKCREDVDAASREAEKNGKNAARVKSYLYGRVKSAIKGEAVDEFYLKVKAILDEEGEVSDILGRLTDGEYFQTLSYEERLRYTMRLSADYLSALEKYKREKEGAIS